MLPQEFLFAQYLTVEQPKASNQVDQQNPIGEHQELPKQDKSKGHDIGLRLANTPVVTSLSEWSTSIPMRKLLPKETRLRSRSIKPARQRITPTQEITSEWKNSWVLTRGRFNAAANTV